MNRFFLGDALKVLHSIESKSVQTCITSPPYFGLRDYGHEGQIGQEQTPSEYVEKLVQVFREVRRTLKDDGTLWLNLGDSYASSGKNRTPEQASANSTLGGSKENQAQVLKQKSKIVDGLKPKDLIGIPWRVAFALQADGWYLRQDIIWNKPNVMPESVRDRCTKSHEYIFLLSKSEKYYFDSDSIKEKASHAVESKYDNGQNGHHSGVSHEGQGSSTRKFPKDPTMRNKRSVWTVTTKPFKGAHFATFPKELIIPCVLAGSRVSDIVLDPFAGSGTTGVVAIENERMFCGVELSPDYFELAKDRISKILI